MLPPKDFCEWDYKKQEEWLKKHRPDFFTNHSSRISQNTDQLESQRVQVEDDVAIGLAYLL